MPDDIRVQAERRTQRILEAHPELLDIPARAQRLLNENTRFAIKSARLYRLADEMKAMLEPFVVCQTGCSHCCYMPTMIYQHEADAMAAAAGCRARKLKYRLAPPALNAAIAFNGKPCPFLSGGRCSIYAHRPLICRVHNSLNDDPNDCLVKPGVARMPVIAMNPDYVETPYHKAVRQWRPAEPWGVIQEFFPEEDRSAKD